MASTCCASSASSSTAGAVSDRRCHSAATASGSPASRGQWIAPISCMPRAARWRRRSASFIGVAGCRLMVGMTVEAEDIATGAEGREQIGKGAVATERRLAADDGNGFVRHVSTQGCGRHRDASALRRAVEGRAAFVVQERMPRSRKNAPTGASSIFISSGDIARAAPAIPTASRSTGLRQLLRFRHAQEEKGTAAAPRQRRERVRRSGEVVSVPSDRTASRRPPSSSASRRSCTRPRSARCFVRALSTLSPSFHGAPGLADAGDAFRRPAGMSHDSAARHEEQV